LSFMVRWASGRQKLMLEQNHSTHS
jgi:hypothetical protein